MDTQNSPGTLVICGKNSVTENRNSLQFYFQNQEAISHAGLNIGDGFVIEQLDDVSMAIIPKKEMATNTVSKKGTKRIIDVKKVPSGWDKGMKLRIIAMRDKIIVTIHHSEKMTADRERDIIERLNEGKEIKVGSILAGKNMRKMLKDCGLVQLSNDISCRLAIELEQSTLQSAITANAEFWQNQSIAATGDLTKIDFSTTELPHLNGLFIDANYFDIRTDKKSGKARKTHASEDYDDSYKGGLFLSIIEIIKRTNPAFANISVTIADTEKPTLEQKAKESSLNIIMTVFRSVFLSLEYDIDQQVKSENGEKCISFLALSKNLHIDQFNKNTVIENFRDEKATPVQPTPIPHTNHKQERIIKREQFLKESFFNNEIPFSSTYSGGGILDRSLHDGLADFNLNSYCKFGMELVDEYFACNLKNNHAIWSEKSYFMLGDVRGVNVYLKRLPQVCGIALGIPCVGASRSGLVKNNITCAEEHETAGALFISSLEIIKSSNAAIVIIENVQEYQSSVSMEIIRSVLNHLGYDICENIYGGNEYGALENRKRLILVASSVGLESKDTLGVLPAYETKQVCLNDIKQNVPLTDSNWKWRDYLDAKAVNDKAKGNNFDQQQLDGTEPKCGCIGRSYSKARSTEPFFKLDNCELYAELAITILNDSEQAQKILSDLCENLDMAHMLINFANDAVKKYNRRNKLEGSFKKVSNLSQEIELLISNKTDSARGISIDPEIISELVETLEALSKATRLFTLTEHADVKRVPRFLVDGQCNTTGHEILGNGVVYSLFRAVGRRISAMIYNFIKPGSVKLIRHEDCASADIPLDVKTHSISYEFFNDDNELLKTETVDWSIVQNNDTIYYINESVRKPISAKQDRPHQSVTLPQDSALAA